eukprot:GEMP01064014.1.p1 GENE.GEMP01064014.1~~GEMP01064014.1.p1  ORF type:complete len:184 (+),score=27.11 GEMP01064014.1:131-682(+)
MVFDFHLFDFPLAHDHTAHHTDFHADHCQHNDVHYTNFALQWYTSIDASKATSEHTETGARIGSRSAYAPEQALQPGTGYWCSAGNHAPDEVVSWVGDLKHIRNVSGVKLSWAYAPGKVRVRETPDGVRWKTVVDWHVPPRQEQQFEHLMTFDKDRNLKSVSIDMMNPKPPGYFGINQIALTR